VGRQAEVFTRELSIGEGQRLQRIARSSREPIRLRRAAVVLASAAGRPVSDIAELFRVSTGYVRKVIHEFNELGFGALDPKWSSGPAIRIGRVAREEICRVGACKPSELGLPFTCWSLRKLADYLAVHARISLSTEKLRQILHAGKITWQATKTWKASKDPDFVAKKDRVLDLYDHPPVDGRVICVDEFGLLNLQPRPGRGWYPSTAPARLRATYTRTGGVRHMFAALDLSSGQMFYRFRDRKRFIEFLDFCKQLRRRFPTGKLYVICDNYGPHKKIEVTDWCTEHDIELIYTPSNASWLNWIESEFQAVRYFTLDGSDYPSHTAQETVIAGYIRWRNQRCHPKRHFAISSKIRRPDYLPKAS
jgi:transposase